MFKDSHVPVIATRRVGQVQEPATVLIPDERNVAQRFDSPLPEGPGWSAESALALVDTAPLGKLKILPPTDPARVSCSYIVKSHARRGRFLPERAKALGVHVKDYSRLTSKETVVTRSGSEVTPEMVLEPDVKGSGFAVVDLWNGKVPASLFGAPEFRDGGIMDGVQVIYYIVDYCKDLGTLREFMELHRDKKHVLLSQGGSDHLVFQSAAAQALTMHAIDPDRFPVPRCDNRLELPAELGRDDAELQVEVGRPGAALKLAHQSPDVFDDSGIIPFQDTDAVVTELRTTRPEVLSLAQAARDKLADPDFVAQLEKTESEIPGREAEIVTIGTGSALPSKYRNVSATLVRVPGHGNYLFDCGENTLGQLRRMVPPATLQSIVQDLRAIFISHLHADHHLGTVSIIDAFRRATRNAEGRGAAEEPGVPGRQVLVLAPSSYLAWLEEYDKVEKYGYGCVQGVPLSATGYDPAKKAAATTTSADFAGSLSPDFSLADFGLTDVQFCSVDHTRDSVAVAMTFRNGLKVAYSGDCRPSRRFAGIGRGAHLLVHECTFADGLEADAADKKHSTMSEALGVARDMGARRVVLTHFSQRYPKTAVFSEQAQKMVDEGPGMVVLFAFDGMRVRLGDFAKAQLFLPALRKLYEPDEDPDAEKAGGGGGEPLSLQDEQRGSI
ncbi:hypothetical protein P8C59_000408 [Phyllachora maydis]|nr:hypothetical protein P8C59_000408 [Phyllachora maydis]